MFDNGLVLFKERLIKLNSVLVSVETWLIVAILSFLLLLGGAQIVLRKVFSTGIPDADILTRNLVSWLTLIGASLAASEGRHININIAENFLSDAKKKYLNLFTNTVVIWVSFKFLFASFQYIAEESTSMFGDKILGIDEWKFSTIFVLGFSLIIFHYTARSILIVLDLLACRARKKS